MQWKCNDIAFIISYSILNSIIFQWPLYRRAASSIGSMDGSGIASLLTLVVFQLAITLVVLTTISIVSFRAMKVLCILLLAGNSIALYFMNSYGVVLDKAMMGNIFNTNLNEARGFAHPKLLIYLTFLAFLPGWCISKLTISIGSRLRRLTFLVITLVSSATWMYVNSHSWLWIDKYAKEFGGMILPWSYVANSVRYYDSVRSRPEPLLLPTAQVAWPGRTVVILVIGESARVQNFSLYGYPRSTNPLLSGTGVVVMPNTHSCSTYTTQSLRCILSHVGGRTSLESTHETLPSYLKRHDVDVIWRTNNFGEPPMKVSSRLAADDIRSGCGEQNCQRLDYDEVLLYGLEEQIRASTQDKVFVVLHQSGSHGPHYFKKYPKEFEKFTPACQTVDAQNCGHDELINAYDNSIAYTDFFLRNVINLLKKLDGVDSTMLYISDHGESLGEYGLYLHGTPYSIAPDFQTKVPFMVWMSDAFIAHRGLAGKAINSGAEYSQDYVFHSVMGGLGLKSPAYEDRFDIFAVP